MKDLSNEELIELYCKASAQESSDLPWGAEERRKKAGDELLSRGLTEIKLSFCEMVVKVRGSDVDARKNTTVFSGSGR
jgi:hypothetical protein